MPPFSTDDNSARSYENDNDNDVRSLNAEENAFLHRENTDAEEVAPEVSSLAGKRTKSRHHIHIHNCRHGQEEEFNGNRRKGIVIESSEYGESDFDRSFETTELNLDSVVSGISRKSSVGTTRTPLHTISERRVAFAGIMVGGFIYDDLEVFSIPHVGEYTIDDKRRIWYTREELRRMRKSCIKTALAISRHIDIYMYCPFYYRGLEHLLDPKTNVLFLPENYVNGDTSDGEETGEYTSTSESRRWDGLEAVLHEQDRQRFVSLEIHPEKVRSVYTTKGKTRKSQSIAHAYALRDEAHANECLGENTFYDEYEYGDNGNCDCNYYHINKKLCNSVRRVFGSLLTPFLDIPHGDIYLAMGDEMI
jgi:hypothetical protein